MLGSLGLLAIVAAPASGRQVARAVPDAGPALAGKSVIWAELRSRRARGGRSVVFRVDGRGRRTKLATSKPKSFRGFEVRDSPGTLFASRSHVVAERELEVCGRDVCDLNHADLVGGPLGKPLGQIGRGTCGRERMADDPFPLDLDEATLAFGCRVGGLGWSVVIRDLGAPARDTKLVSSRRHGIDARVAGRLIAWKRETRRREVITVFDRLRRRVIYSVHAAAVGADIFDDWDLQADGKVAATFRASRPRARAALVWFSPQHRRARRLRLHGSPCVIEEDVPNLQLARGRVATLVTQSNEAVDGCLDAQLVVKALGGREHRVVGFSRRRLRVGDIDFDGRRVTWAAQRVDRYRRDCPDNPLILAPCLITPIGPTGIVVARLPAESP